MFSLASPARLYSFPWSWTEEKSIIVFLVSKTVSAFSCGSSNLGNQRREYGKMSIYYFIYLLHPNQDYLPTPLLLFILLILLSIKSWFKSVFIIFSTATSTILHLCTFLSSDFSGLLYATERKSLQWFHVSSTTARGILCITFLPYKIF